MTLTTRSGKGSALTHNELDGNFTHLQNYYDNVLSAAILTQLANIGATTISGTQWGYVGDLDQALSVGSNVSFGGGTFAGVGSFGVAGSSGSRNTLTLLADGSRILYGTSATKPNWKASAQDEVDLGYTISVGTTNDSDPTNDTFTDVITVLSSGFVGLGLTTGTPTRNLHVNSGASGTIARFSTDIVSTKELYIYADAARTGIFDTAAAGGSGFNILADGTLDFRISSASVANFNSSGKLTVDGGAKISVQNTVDGTSAHGIFLNDTTDTDYGIYTASSGALKSLADSTACAALDGRTGFSPRTRVFGGGTNSIIWENHGEVCLMSLTADTGDLYTLGGFYNTTNSNRSALGNKVAFDGSLRVIDATNPWMEWWDDGNRVGRIAYDVTNGFIIGSHNGDGIVTAHMSILNSGTADFQGNVLSGVGDILSGASSGSMTISGGGILGDGGRVVLYGESHATRANDIELLASGSNVLAYDHSAGTLQINKDLILADKFRLGSPSELTIASGAVTVTKAFHTIDTESDAATDDLETINGGTNGDRLILTAANNARTVVVKDGTGNINLEGDFSMDSDADILELIYYNSAWREVSRANNAA